jgi:hypothetical protein
MPRRLATIAKSTNLFMAMAPAAAQLADSHPLSVSLQRSQLKGTLTIAHCTAAIALLMSTTQVA